MVRVYILFSISERKRTIYILLSRQADTLKHPQIVTFIHQVYSPNPNMALRNLSLLFFCLFVTGLHASTILIPMD
ncbi:MAG: hypothetical protein AAFN92_02500, partial [Bacteroidota bacterium]